MLGCQGGAKEWPSTLYCKSDAASHPERLLTVSPTNFRRRLRVAGLWYTCAMDRVLPSCEGFGSPTTPDTQYDPPIRDEDLDAYLAAWAESDDFDCDVSQLRADAAEASAIFTPRGIARAEARHFHLRERALATEAGRRRAPAKPCPAPTSFSIAPNAAFRAIVLAFARRARDTLAARLHGLVHHALTASRLTTSPVFAA